MTNKKFWLGILVMVLVFGMTVVGCDDGSTDGGTDSALNGTWVDEDGMELKLNNGNLEVSGFMKGTYTASDGKMTMQTTQINSSMIGEEGEMLGLEPNKWYSKGDLKAAIKKSPFFGVFITEADIDEMLNDMFMSQTGTYSVNGNKLTFTMDGETSTFTKK